MFKAKQRISPEIVSELLQFLQKPYNCKKNKTDYFGTKCISSLAP